MNRRRHKNIDSRGFLSNGFRIRFVHDGQKNAGKYRVIEVYELASNTVVLSTEKEAVGRVSLSSPRNEESRLSDYGIG